MTTHKLSQQRIGTYKSSALRVTLNAGERVFGSVVSWAQPRASYGARLLPIPVSNDSAGASAGARVILAGALMLGDALFTETPSETLTKIWRDAPSLVQYQSSVRYAPTSASVPTAPIWCCREASSCREASER